MKIAVVGAGPAGLVSLKYSLDHGHECEVFEQSGVLGGTWVYTDNIGTDENGLPIHSSMYQGMRTNLPKEVMFFLDYPYPSTKTKSYLSQPEVLEYFINYANHFQLEKYIKYYRCVTEVTPIHTSKWQLKIQDAKTKQIEIKTYDAVFICNGHYSDPFVPSIPGQNEFEGKQLHSHHYRTPEFCKDKRVLLVGAGSSGTDIAVKVSQVSKEVFLSCKQESFVHKSIKVKPVISRFNKNYVEFEDNSKEYVDIVIYCTGYLYSYPFLSDNCDIKVEDNWVHPLYKHVVNIKHPTMFFIGVPFLVPVIPVCDVQVRFALASLANEILPSEKDMLKELNEYINARKNLHIPQRYMHKIGSNNLETYFQELSSFANITPIPTTALACGNSTYSTSFPNLYLNTMKVGVIGGGPSGLVVAKYCIANNFDCDVYEQRSYLGGTWNRNYSDEDPDDKLIYTKLYQGVLTNIPKEIMMYPDYSYPPEETKSFLGPVEVFDYFKGYADTFNVHHCMKYRKIVLNVCPNSDETWTITFKDLKTKLIDEAQYDAVFVCTGHLWYPITPKFPGQSIFKGSQTHSSNYNLPDPYKDKTVVVVGARSSARDVVEFISLFAKHVYVSYRDFCLVQFKENVSPKPYIKEIKETSIIFEDGTEEMVDDIVYCTGYDYSFPYLSEQCEISIDDKYIYPLYQHIVNANHPTMFFIGVPSVVCAIPLFDLQVRFAFSVLQGNCVITKEEMLKDLDKKREEREKLDIPQRHAHKMGEYQEAYWAELARVGSITPLPPVLCRIYDEVRKGRHLNLHYKILDDENFEIYSED
ncbi:hypothetical protein RN001_000562 [Aquatica leii]|uniref:Flavin-containing monooxygenase n=1 Tax=Aquatica leii TaxID=1421715 RepID=A0AAN7PKA4_9COLE|nr:hypothetical protein RN001_000562 [Aquatica leii]